MAQPPLVLIVDDDQTLREMLRDFLGDVGYQRRRRVTAPRGSTRSDGLLRTWCCSTWQCRSWTAWHSSVDGVRSHVVQSGQLTSRPATA